MSCADPPALWRCSSNSGLSEVLGRGKSGISGCSIFSFGRNNRTLKRISSRLLFDVCIFAPILEIPLAKTLLSYLGEFPITSPGIQGAVIHQEMRRVVHRRSCDLLYGVVFLGVAEHVACECERKALYQWQIALCRHHPAPLVNLIADVDLYGANIRT